MTAPEPAPQPQPGRGLDLFGGASAEQVKKHTAEQRAELARQKIKLETDLAAQRAELDEARRKMEAEFRAKQAELEAAMGPLRAELKRMEEIGQTIDLYLGRGEEVEIVRDGKPAAADEPIVIRQSVLAMSEEAIVLFSGEEGYEGIDYTNVDTFIDWLQAPENLDRLLPEPKCVVVLIPTREASTAENIWEATHKNAKNRQSYWFMRNGERVTLMRTDTITVRDRLVPKRDEFVSYFADRFGHTMTPGSPEWVKAEEDADARRRHFMKLMLTLQGLVDRTSTWHPLPANGVNLMSVASQDNGQVRIVNEVDLILTDGRESFKEWRQRLNSQLRPGHRVIGNWGSREFGWANEYERSSHYKHSRIYPPTAPRPDSETLHTIEGMRDGMLVIRYERTDKVYKRNVPVPDKPGYVYTSEMPVTPTQRASCLIDTTDTWVLPFDLATVDDLTYYLNSREARTDFLSMVPVVRAALTAKRAEAEAEAPFRDLLARQIEAAGCDPSDTDTTVDRLVHAWKVKNKYGRALNGDADHEAKAARQIIAAYKAEQKHASHDERMIAAARRAAPDMICVGATKAGVWRAYAPSKPAHDEGVFLDVYELRKDGTVKDVQRERIIATRHRPTHIAWSAPEWDTWTFDANPRRYLTSAVRDEFISHARNDAKNRGWDPICVVELYDPTRSPARQLSVYAWTPDTAPADYPASVEGNGWAGVGSTFPIGALDFAVDGDDIHLTRESATRRFSAYSATYRDHEGLPWWPDNATRYRDTRNRLTWVDDNLFDQYAQWSKRGKASDEADREARLAERARNEATVTPYVNAMLDIARTEQLTAVKAAFIEDYGTNAEDVWEHHLSTLKLPEPLHPFDVKTVLIGALTAGEPFVGRTLGDLADAHGERQTAAFFAGRERDHDVTFHADVKDMVVPELPEPADEANVEEN